MAINIRIIKNSFSVLMVLFFVGCAVKPLDLYPDFRNKKTTMHQTKICLDLIARKDISGKLDAVDIPKSLESAEWLLKHLESALKEKGYDVTGGSVLGSGFPFKVDQEVKIIRDEKDRETSPGKLEKTLPPFYINDALQSDPELKDSFLHLARELAVLSPKTKGRMNPHFDDAVKIGQKLECDYMVVVFAGGRYVSFGKSLGQGILTAVLTLGIVSIYEVPYSYISFSIIDTKNGELIWHDFVQGEYVNEKWLTKMVKGIINHLP